MLTEEGRRQADGRGARAGGGRASTASSRAGSHARSRPRAIVAPGVEPEARYGLREIESGEIRGLAPEDVQEMMSTAFRGVVPLDTRFLGGETIGALFDRALPELEALLADETWDVLLLVLHGAVNRAILGHALTGDRVFLGGFEQSPGCINVLDVGVDGLDRASRQPHAVRPRTRRRAARRPRWSSSGRSTSRRAARDSVGLRRLRMASPLSRARVASLRRHRRARRGLARRRRKARSPG